MVTGSYLSIITLNVNGLNVPTKRQRLAEWIQKQDPYILSTRDPPQNKGKIYNEDYCIQQGSHSKSMEKLKAFQTSNS